MLFPPVPISNFHFLKNTGPIFYCSPKGKHVFKLAKKPLHSNYPISDDKTSKMWQKCNRTAFSSQTFLGYKNMEKKI